jgi:hypothetical protein
MNLGQMVAAAGPYLLPVLTLALGWLLNELSSRHRASQEVERDNARAQRDADQEHDRWLRDQRLVAYKDYVATVTKVVFDFNLQVGGNRESLQQVIASRFVLDLVGPKDVATAGEKVMQTVIAIFEDKRSGDDAVMKAHREALKAFEAEARAVTGFPD